MNLRLIALIALSLTSSFLLGCANPTTTTRTTTERKDVELTTEKKSYSARELEKRGRQNPGENLAAEDPSVYISSGGRR
ncbi:MAG: hypothetical protein ACR2ID_06300 [Chthoniobacterales bacterium]